MSTITKITAWSYSRYTTYMDCPRKAFYKFVKRMPEPGSEAMERGDAIHKTIEAYLNGGKRVLPKEIHSKSKEYYKLIKGRGPKVEMEAAFNVRWERVDWFDRSAWCR